MGIGEGLFLGILQGLTEFLPVSSSGHLVILQYYLGIREPQLFFAVLLHGGTLLALLLFFRQEIGRIILSLIKIRDNHYREYRWLAGWLGVATIPALVVGVFLHKEISLLFNNVALASTMLLVTGIWLWVGERSTRRRGRLGLGRSFLIGLSQAVAIIPGISRSGATIVTGMKVGLNREKAFQFSFLLSIPAIGGAMVMEGGKWKEVNPSYFLPYLGGFLSAFAVGYLSLIFLRRVLIARKLRLFAYYCFAVGITSLLLWGWK